MSEALETLKGQLQSLGATGGTYAPGCQPAPFGIAAMDEVLKGGLHRAVLHEFCAVKTSHSSAVSGFSACMVQQLSQELAQGNAPVVWIRQTMGEHESGQLYPHGLQALGLSPHRVVMVRVRRALDALAATLEAVRCASVGAVLSEVWGTPKELDLTATRRLALAAEHSGVTPILLRAPGSAKAEVEHSSAAFTRWQVRSAPSRALPANAPGRPSFHLTLTRNKAGTHGQSWQVEWQHDLGQFQSRSSAAKAGKPSTPYQPLSGGMVSLSARAAAGERTRLLARTG